MNSPHRFLTWRHEEELNDDDAAVIPTAGELTVNPVAVPHKPGQDQVPRKLAYLKDSKRPNAGTFVLSKEDHTIGNLVRLQLLRDKRVRFAGYRMPHPLIYDCHVRVETMDASSTPQQVFESALADLHLELDHLDRCFNDAVENFQNSTF